MQSEAARRTGEYRLGQWVTLVVYENNPPRRIYTDGRGFDAEDNVPSFPGYSIGKWPDLRVTVPQYHGVFVSPRHLRLQRDAAAFSFDPWTFPH
jgi:hypothetical protein